MRRPPRLVVFGLALVGIVAFSGLWAVPNVFGGMFVRVRAVVTPVPSAAGPSVTLASGQTVRAGQLEFSADVENSYLLSVVLPSDPVAYTAAIYAHSPSGSLVKIWQSDAGDPVAEEGSDSPVGGGSAKGAVVVPPGTARHSIASGASAFGLVRPAGAGIASDVYYVRVWAYGIASPMVPLSIDTTE
jgi:hypothetical protein